MHLVDGDFEIGWFFGAIRDEREGEVVADLGADELIVEAASNPTLADFVEPIFGVETDNWLAVTQTLQVERDLIAKGDGPLDIGEGALTTEFFLYLGVDIGVGAGDGRDFDTQAAVAGHGDLGADLTRCVERDRTTLFAAGDFDFGRSDEVDIVLSHGLRQIVRHAIAKCLLASGCNADAGFEHFARSFTGSKAWQPHLTSDLFEC